MVKNFIPNCDLCGQEISLEERTTRNVRANGVELLIVALENSDRDLQFTKKSDGTVDLDACTECYMRLAFHHSQAVN